MANTEDIVKNFGQIKECFNDILIESIVTQNTDKNKLFKKYVFLVNENKILKTQFLVYSNIENKVEPDIYKATQFVSESIALLSKYKKKDILEANKKLAENLYSFESEIKTTAYSPGDNLDKVSKVNVVFTLASELV